MTELRPIAAKRYLSFPPREPHPGPIRSKLHHLVGAAALPIGLAAGWLYGGTGLHIRSKCFALALRALRAGHRTIASNLLLFPMDSFRYFELAFMQTAARSLAPRRYLDVSSPRLVPLMLLDRANHLTADLINPIESDLNDTREMARALRLDHRIRAHSVLIEDADFADGTFDLISSISVVEHIPDDTAAIASMWRLLKPGGKLVITVPCARVAAEEYTNVDEYELFEKNEERFVYWQRYYDYKELQERIWSTTGQPDDIVIFGEKISGSYDRNVMQKRSFANYPYWQEPFMMAREYRYYDTLDEMPGMGVVGMVFTKPAQSAGA